MSTGCLSSDRQLTCGVRQTSLAAEYGLHQVYKEEFHTVFEEHHEHSEFAQLLQRMHVVDANGESQMDEDQWDAASECFGPPDPSSIC